MANSSPEKFYCGTCGAPLYYGANFKAHQRTRACPRCETLNPVYFHFCFRCGLQILEPALSEEEEAGRSL